MTSKSRAGTYSSRIEICGGIGAGKSTVASALAQAWSLRLIREPYADIVAWKNYFRNPDEYEFEKNLSFLLAYGDAIKQGLRDDLNDNPAILDFAMFQVLAYADLSDSEADSLAIQCVYDRMFTRIGPPSALLYVHCPVELQIERIRKRGRDPEAGIEVAYLRELSGRIESRVDKLRATLPVIEIDTSELDFVVHSEVAVGEVERRLHSRMARIGDGEQPGGEFGKFIVSRSLDSRA